MKTHWLLQKGQAIDPDLESRITVDSTLDLGSIDHRIPLEKIQEVLRERSFKNDSGGDSFAETLNESAQNQCAPEILCV